MIYYKDYLSLLYCYSSNLKTVEYIRLDVTHCLL